jgi:hypothetical protein
VKCPFCELEELQKWKTETLEVESQWCVQAVGGAIGLTLGERIRPAILPYIRNLQDELAEADQKWERRLIAALGGHADSKLWGDDGLIAATWRCVEGYEKMEKELAEAKAYEESRLKSTQFNFQRYQEAAKQRDTLAEALLPLLAMTVAMLKNDTKTLHSEITITDKKTGNQTSMKAIEVIENADAAYRSLKGGSDE